MADHNAPPWVLILITLISATSVVLAAVLSQSERGTVPAPTVNAVALAASLTATSMPSRACVVPRLERSDQEAAEIAISQLGLQLVKISQYNAEVATGLVLSQDPPAGRTLNPCKGDVEIGVSLGPLPTPKLTTNITVPLTITTAISPQPTESANAIDLSGTWIYQVGNDKGVTVIKQNGNQVEMTMIWTPLDNFDHPGYKIKAALSGNSIDGTWHYIRTDNNPNIQQSGQYHATVSDDGNRIEHFQTEDSGNPKHNFDIIVFHRV